MKKKTKKENDSRIEKEVRQIRDLLILIAINSGMTPDEVNLATGMGAGNIRARFPISRKKRKKSPATSSKD